MFSENLCYVTPYNLEQHKLKGGEFYVNVHETNYRRLEPALRIAVSGYMGVGIFIHKVVEILGKQ